MRHFATLFSLGVLFTQASFTQSRIISQVADGGGWQTTVAVANTTNAAVVGSLRFHQEISGRATQDWPNADTAFRNRYNSTINFDSVAYYAGNSPPETKYRENMAAGKADGVPGPNVGINSGLGGSACVVVDRIRFGSDAGPYYNP